MNQQTNRPYCRFEVQLSREELDRVIQTGNYVLTKPFPTSEVERNGHPKVGDSLAIDIIGTIDSEELRITAMRERTEAQDQIAYALRLEKFE